MTDQADDDEQSTLILDFNALKESLNQQEDIISGLDEELEFSAEASAEVELRKESSKDDKFSKKSIYFFGYKTNYFIEKVDFFSSLLNIEIISDLKILNKNITENPTSILVFFYNDTPKAINQLSGQLKNKFPKMKSLIIAKNLSKEKAQKHASSKFGAHAYLNDPFQLDDFRNQILKLNLD